MDLESCTPGQRASIERVDGPLLVSAGAGSGKTFTLTQRIAYALLPASGPAASGIHEVLAITFTEKAAAEIKARVKRTLRAEGGRLAEEALKVDAAWISTIHGMCARILRAHALELGLDPTFGILGEAERADLLAACIDDALGGGNDIIDRGSYAALFDEYPARSALPGAPSVASMLQTLLDKAAGLRGGLDAVDFGPPPARAGDLARALLAAYEDVAAALEQAGGSATAERARAQAADAARALRAFLDGRGAGSQDDAARAQEDLRALAEAVDGCERVGGNFKATVKPQVKAYQDVHAHVCRELALALAWPRAHELIALAREVARRYEGKKSALCKLDNDDLLVKTLAAFEGHPALARSYESRFKLVMVDEFQDTSQLQIDLIAHLAGPNLSRLCTVGDAQQSIYRFRGADVNVYEAHKRAMRSREVGALYVELAKNFRSHADVLAFVDCVFGQPHVFGDGFMPLEPNAARRSSFKGSGPRIEVVLAVRPGERGSGVSADDAKAACARAVARRFAALRACGHEPGDMVVLLGRMSRAEVYAQALRDEGFECAVTGGSLFASAPEVRVVARLAEALANPANTAALFEVLTSDLVRLPADDLLELATEKDEDTGELRRRDLDRGFARLSEREGALPSRLAHAVGLISRAQRDARTQALSRVVLDVAVRSGWMARLEGQGAAGLARAANVLKAVRLMEQLEGERHLGLASTARAFAAELATGAKEAPGSLSGKGGNAVKIMTIHASKGLEFPIVALAEFAGNARAQGRLVVETCGPAARASLSAGGSLDGLPGVARRATGCFEDGECADGAAARRLIDEGAPAHDGRGIPACSQDAYRLALRERAAAEELAEARRKLYVGLTRASEALVVAMDAKAPAPGKPPTYPDLVDDVRSALCGAADFPEGVAELDYGGSAPARFERIAVRAEDGEAERIEAQNADRGAPFAVPRTAGCEPAPRRPWGSLRAGVFSYTSIALVHGRGAPSFEGVASPVPEPRAPQAAVPAGEGEGARPNADADKATGLGSAFHRAAQFAVETGGAPDAARLEVLARALGLPPAHRARLEAACARWFASAVHAETLAWPLRRAEVPFCVRVGEALMEGEIDLLCTKGPDASGPALVIDYKTGGSDAEDPAQVRERHLLQAQCYAYALLSQGFSSVELRFVRVEREQQPSATSLPSSEAAGGTDGEPQVVTYRFERSDRPALGAVIARAYAAARP